MRRVHALVAVITAIVAAPVIAFTASSAIAQSQSTGWPAYGRDAGGSRYSPITEIDSANVSQLRLAWIARTGDYLTDRGPL